LSYVGEAGWEITCDREDAGVIYDALYEAGARPAGLLAQTSMRIEKGYLAYGNDLDTDISPLEAGLEFAVGWDTDFIGKEALLARKSKPLSKRMVSILLDDVDAVPLGNEPVVFQGEMCGKTTSAGFGYRVGRPVALALVDSEILVSDNEQIVEIDIAGEFFSGQIVRSAAFDSVGDTMRG